MGCVIRHRWSDRSLVAKRGHVFADGFIPFSLANLTDVPRTWAFRLRLCFPLRRPYSASSKNRTATFRESRSFSLRNTERRNAIDNRLLPHVRPWHWVHNRRKSDRLLWKHGNFSLSLYAAMEPFYVSRVCVVSIFKRNKKKSFVKYEKKFRLSKLRLYVRYYVEIHFLFQKFLALEIKL